MQEAISFLKKLELMEAVDGGRDSNQRPTTNNNRSDEHGNASQNQNLCDRNKANIISHALGTEEKKINREGRTSQHNKKCNESWAKNGITLKF